MSKKESIQELKMIKGVSDRLAQELYAAGFRSIGDMMNASEEDLSSVKGIGPKLAKNIKKQLEETKEEETPPTAGIPVYGLSKEEKERMENIRQIRKSIPDFRRQEWYRYKRLGTRWKRPTGRHTKQRLGKRYRSPRVSIGYRTPRNSRNLHPSGFREVVLSTPNQLSELDPRKEAVRISSTVGGRKRVQIIEEASKLGIKILNRGRE
jgi:large subunit ribosomal protein L32e